MCSKEIVKEDLEKVDLKDWSLLMVEDHMDGDSKKANIVEKLKKYKIKNYIK